MNPSESLLINGRLDAMQQCDEDARKAIAALCERVSSLEEFSRMHNFAISHCSGGCRAELHKPIPFEE